MLARANKIEHHIHYFERFPISQFNDRSDRLDLICIFSKSWNSLIIMNMVFLEAMELEVMLEHPSLDLMFCSNDDNNSIHKECENVSYPSSKIEKEYNLCLHSLNHWQRWK